MLFASVGATYMTSMLIISMNITRLHSPCWSARPYQRCADQKRDSKKEKRRV